MEILGHLVAQRLLQKYLARCTSQKIGSAHYLGDALSIVVDHYCQVVGVYAVAAADYKVTDRGCDILRLRAVNAVNKGNEPWWRSEPKRRGTRRGLASVSAGSGIAQLVGVIRYVLCGDLCASTRTFVDAPLIV
jgi:hypothetical protein